MRQFLHLQQQEQTPGVKVGAEGAHVMGMMMGRGSWGFGPIQAA